MTSPPDDTLPTVTLLHPVLQPPRTIADMPLVGQISTGSGALALALLLGSLLLLEGLLGLPLAALLGLILGWLALRLAPHAQDGVPLVARVAAWGRWQWRTRRGPPPPFRPGAIAQEAAQARPSVAVQYGPDGTPRAVWWRR